MNAQTLRALSGSGRLGCRRTKKRGIPFSKYDDAEAFFLKLRSNVPTFRTLIGRLRDESKGNSTLLLWLRKIGDEFEQRHAARRERESRARRPRWQDVAHVPDDNVQEREFERDPALIGWALP